MGTSLDETLSVLNSSPVPLFGVVNRHTPGALCVTSARIQPRFTATNPGTK